MGDKLSDKEQKRQASIIKRYGSLEKYKEAAKEWGRKGGVTNIGKGGGFQAMTPEQRRELGRKGWHKMIENRKNDG